MLRIQGVPRVLFSSLKGLKPLAIRLRLFLEAQKLLTSKCEATSAEKGQVVRKQPLVREIDSD